ncbi:MAG: hypothetical protein V7K28_28970 [Nostoc sp.]
MVTELVVPLRGSKLRAASVYDTLRERREVRATPTQTSIAVARRGFLYE